MSTSGAPGVFIAGTDTGVGKTRVTLGLIRALRAGGVQAEGMKPVASGMIAHSGLFINEDTHAIAELNGNKCALGDITPYCFDWAASPHIGAERAGVVVDLRTIVTAYARLSTGSSLMVVEGTGGWLTPIGEQGTMADVARVLGLPVVLVVGLRLGCLNHALLSAQAIRQRGASLAGWIGNQIDAGFARLPQNVSTLAQHLGMPPIAIVAHASHRHETGCLGDAAVAMLMHAATPKQLT